MNLTVVLLISAVMLLIVFWALMFTTGNNESKCQDVSSDQYYILMRHLRPANFDDDNTKVVKTDKTAGAVYSTHFHHGVKEGDGKRAEYRDKLKRDKESKVFDLRKEAFRLRLEKKFGMR